MIDYFRIETGSERTYDSIMSKWKTRIRNRVANFGAIMDNVKLTHGSGENDMDDKQKALLEYEVRYGHEFLLYDCWKIMKDHDAWKREIPLVTGNTRKKSKGSTTTSGSTQGPSNFQDLDVSDDEAYDTREARPRGRDAARKKSSSSRDSQAPPKSWTKALLSDFWSMKPSKSGKNKDLESWKALKEQELAIKREKVKAIEKQTEILSRTKEEQDLIFYNSAIDPNLTERQKQENIRLKEIIKARYGLDY